MERSAEQRAGRIAALPIAAGVLALGVVLTWACHARESEKARAEAQAPPADAIFRLDGHEVITAAEVDAWLECMHLIEKNATLPQQRRLALTNIVLPRAVARNIDRRAFETARERVDAIHARLLDGGQPGVDVPASEIVDGTWKDTGLDVWWACRDLVPGEWSAPLESIGSFEVCRLVEEPEKPLRPAGKMKVEIIRIPYIPTEGPRALVQQAMEESQLEILDPAWAELLPLIYHNDMESKFVTLPRSGLPAEDGQQ